MLVGLLANLLLTVEMQDDIIRHKYILLHML